MWQWFFCLYLILRRLLPVYGGAMRYVDGVPIRLPRIHMIFHIVVAILLYAYAALRRNCDNRPDLLLTVLWLLLDLSVLPFLVTPKIRNLSETATLIPTLLFMILLPLPTSFQWFITRIFLAGAALLSLSLELSSHFSPMA